MEPQQPIYQPMMPAPHSKVAPAIIIAIIILAAGGLVAAKQQKWWPFAPKAPVAMETATPSPTPSATATASVSATPDVTSGWKIYTSTQYGFEVKYPFNGKVVGSLDTNGSATIFPDAKNLLPQSGIGLSIHPLGQTAGAAGENWQITTLGNRTATKVARTSEIGDSIIVYLVEIGQSKELAITVPGRPGPSIYDQIFSTFKFTTTQKPTLTSLDATWSLYTNPMLGFSMKIPKKIYGGGTVTIKESGTDAVDIGGWHIITGTVNTEAELGQFAAKNPFWTHCQVEDVSPVSGKNYSAVTLKRTDPEGGCFTNYAYSIFYSPSKHRAASWVLGQDVTFSGPNGGQDAYDQAMIQSFTFLP